jgi:FKBP-type peptidyl-prolyl cis-trans isomerase FkpA
MRRIAFLIVLAALACSGGEKSEPAAPAPEAAPAAPEASSAAPAAEAPAAVVGETITLPSGVKVTHRVIGTGPNPSATDRVTVHYEGTFPDGKVFDSSVQRGQPATFPLNGVIDCWTEGVQLMKEGGKAQLICPPQTAYGERGQGGVIPPNATLQFEVELIKVL